jgi:hypothetical protein
MQYNGINVNSLRKKISNDKKQIDNGHFFFKKQRFLNVSTHNWPSNPLSFKKPIKGKEIEIS